MSILPPPREFDVPRSELATRPAVASSWDEPGLAEQPSQGIDYLGIAWRRKWVLILFALIGAAIAYLVYTKTPITYQSALRVMIWSQSPPMMVNGDSMVQKVSLPKHQSLIVSDLVLSNAVADSQIGKLETVLDKSPVGYMKQFVKVRSVAESADALDLTITGPNAEDLPVMLAEIVKSYEQIVAQDSVDIGKDSVVLMETLHKKLETEKNAAEERYYELFKKLGLTEASLSEEIANPHAAKITSLTLKIEEESQELEDILKRLRTLTDYKQSDTKAPETTKLLAVEAKRYLQLPTSANELQGMNSIQEDLLKSLPIEMQREYQRKVRQIDEIEIAIQQREIERARWEGRYGARHFMLKGIDNDIASRREQLEELKTELDVLDKEAVRLSNDGAGGKQPIRTVEELTMANDGESIALYELSLAHERDDLEASIRNTTERLEQTETMAASISADLAELNILKNQIDEKRQSIREILDRLAEMNVLAGNYTYTKVRVIDPPGLGYRVGPNLLRYLGTGIAIASILGFGLAFLIDWSDQSFRNPQEIATVLRTPVLGKVPIIRDARKSKSRAASLITVHRSNSVASEAFRSIRTSVAFVAGRIGGKVFIITSASPGDGKSTMAANLAVSMAQMGKKVVLVDGDFRRPRVHQIFETSIEPGTYQHLDEGLPLNEVIRPMEAMPNLHLLTVGGYPGNPGELVSSARFEDMLINLRRDFDYVLIDSPPILPVADAVGMSAFVDGIMMVIRIRRGVIVASQKAKEQLDMVNGRLIGVIVNGVDNNPYYSDYGRYGYRYGYGYGYGGNGGYGKYYDSMKANYYDRINDGNA
jgi:polysaccharide biosynthesis transport protein